MRKLAIIDKNPDAKFTQWRAAPEPKKFFHKDNSLVSDIKKYDPDFIFINKGNIFSNIPVAVNSYKSIYFYGDFYKPIPEFVRNYASICTATVLTNKDQQLWKSLGSKNIHFVSQGADTDIFKPVKCDKKYDIVFTGNYYGTKFCGSDIRLKLVRYIACMGYDFKVVGDGWPPDVDSLPRQGAKDLNKTINQAWLTIGMSHFVDVPYYTSNRLYQSMATGVPHIAWYSPGVKELFKHGYLEVKTYSELNSLVHWMLTNTKRLAVGTGKIQKHEILKRHTIFHFWNKIEAIMESL
jgi:spore maturation protein CgeB